MEMEIDEIDVSPLQIQGPKSLDLMTDPDGYIQDRAEDSQPVVSLYFRD